MPSGVYKRKHSQKLDESISRNFAKGKTPEARQKAAETCHDTWTDEKRKAFSKRMKEIMRRPDIREKHLAALENIPVNFKGGNGQPITEAVRIAASILEPLGFIREFPVKTKGHGTDHRCPSSYKVDFGHPEKKVALELDGPSHSSIASLEFDAKKTQVLEALQWKVIRISHDKEVNPSHLSALIIKQLEALL